MSTITLEPTTQTKLEQFAQHHATSVEEMVHQAVDRYLDYLSEQQLEREINAFEQMHETLKRDYWGQYVAIHQAQVIDHDGDVEALFLRVQQTWGDITVLIRQVTESPHEQYQFHGVRLEQGS